MQYAYANPGTYTIYTIDSGNESVIDTLNLSVNTKANMHADVQEGWTIITLDKAVTEGTFTGILYVSLDTDGTALYAIGEQSQGNGGSTVDILAIAADIIFGLERYEFQGNDFIFIYREKNSNRSISCRMDIDKFNNIVRNEDSEGNPILESNPAYYTYEYGLPCMLFHEPRSDDSYHFGSFDHKGILATDGAKFYMANKYHYWVTDKYIEDTMFLPKNGDTDGLNGVNLDHDFGFNPVFGTYFMRGTYTGPYNEPGGTSARDAINIYYKPGWQHIYNVPESEGAYFVYGRFLATLSLPGFEAYYWLCEEAECPDDKDFWVINRLGYPLGNQVPARESQRGTTGDYQGFIGGHLYWNDDMNKGFYVPGKIAETFDSDTYCKKDSNNNCEYDNYGHIIKGTGGDFGFPIGYPLRRDSTAETIIQDFEGGEITLFYDNATNTELSAQAITFPMGSGDQDWVFFWDGAIDSFYEQDLFSIASDIALGVALDRVIQRAAEKIVERFGKKAVVKIGLKFVPYVGWVVAGVLFIVEASQLAPLMSKCTSGEYDSMYYCGKLSVHIVVIGIGIKLDMKIQNMFGVNTSVARLGKAKLLSKLGENDVSLWNKLKLQISAGTDKAAVGRRTKFFEDVEGLDDTSIYNLSRDEKVTKRLLDKENYGFNSKLGINNVKTPEEINAIFIADGQYGPYKAGNAVSEMVTNQKISGEFVRVHGSANQDGEWIVRKSELEDLKTPAEIKDKLGLKYEPTHISEVTVPSNTTMRNGIAAPQPQWNNAKGGAEQFEILGDLSGVDYYGEKPLQEWFNNS